MAINGENARRAIGIIKFLIDLGSQNWPEAGKSGAELLASLIPPPKEGDAGEQAEVLLRRAAARAALTVIAEHDYLTDALAKVDPKSVKGDIKGAKLEVPPLTASAFTDIGAWDALPPLRELFAFWLKACGVAEERRPTLVRCFIESLPGALRDETLDHAGDYAALNDWLNRATRFDPVVVVVENWRKYRQTLIADVRKPHSKLLEDFPDKAHLSLRDLYIPLRATWVEHPKPEPVRRHHRPSPVELAAGPILAVGALRSEDDGGRRLRAL